MTKTAYGYFCGGNVVEASEMKRQFLSKGLKVTTGQICIRRLTGKQCRIGIFNDSKWFYYRF